jgi:hypothetical protein
MTDADTIRLGAIRRRHQEASTDWAFTVTDEGEALTARVIPVEEPYTVLTFGKECTASDRALISHAPDDLGFTLGLLDRAFAAIRQLRKALDRNTPKPKDYAAECAMKVRDPDFQLFMMQVHGVDNASDPIRIDNRIKSMLRITSKKELNDNQDAATAWRELVGASEAWNKQRRRR